MARSALLIALLVAFAAHTVTAGTSVPVTVNLNGDLDLPANQVATLKTQALEGSGAAARRLAMYFLFARHDRSPGMYRETISAEDGYPPGMDGLAVNSIDETDRQSETRARFWLTRAVEAGYEPAREHLRELEGAPPHEQH